MSTSSRPSSASSPAGGGLLLGTSPDVDDAISINTTMMTDFTEGDVVLDGESILDSMRLQHEAGSHLTRQSINDTFYTAEFVSDSMIASNAEEDEPSRIEQAEEAAADVPVAPTVPNRRRRVSFTDEAVVPNRRQVLADSAKNNQLNAVQTPFGTISVVLCYHSSDQEKAKQIRDHFAGLDMREEVLPGPVEQTDATEFRLILLSVDFMETASEEVLNLAKSAAISDRLVINRLCTVDKLNDEWKELCQNDDYAFSAIDEELFQIAIDQTERFLYERVALENDEYPSVLQIDEYIILEELGHGAQGVVYKAKHEISEEIVAIKELRNMAGKVSSQVRTEIAIMKRLDHPNVAKLLKVYQPDARDSTSLFLVLEHVPGGSLMTDSDVWRGTAQPLSVERAQIVFQQLVRGLSYLHYMGVLHRDIKPSNILGHRDEGGVKLSDFGVSSFTKQQKSAKILGEDDIICVGSCGTPAFLPPEASGAGIDNKYHGRVADVWSLGVTLYVLLSGHLPFKGQDRNSTALAICKDKLRVPSHIPSVVKELLVRILEKDPSKRATLVWIANHPWVNVGNWKNECPGLDQVNSKISEREIAQSLSFPQSLKKTIKKRSQSVLRHSGAFISSVIQSPMRLAQAISNATSQDTSVNDPSTMSTAVSATTIATDIETFFRTWFCCAGEDRDTPSATLVPFPSNEGGGNVTKEL